MTIRVHCLAGQASNGVVAALCSGVWNAAAIVALEIEPLSDHLKWISPTTYIPAAPSRSALKLC